MKKIAIAVVAVITLSLAFASPAFAAGAQKLDLIDDDGHLATAEDGIHADANGFVILNTKANGTTDAVIQIQLRDGAPEYNYVVKSAGDVIGNFTTNKKGSGGCHINMADEDALGGAINIWTSDENTRLLRALIP